MRKHGAKLRNITTSVILQKSTSRIHHYRSDKPLELKGQFTTILESKTQFTPAVIQVAKGKVGSLLNCHTTCELVLIRLHVNNIDNETTATQEARPHITSSSRPAQQISLDSPTFKQDVLDKYPDLWKDGRVGKLKDFEVKLHIDPSVQPVIQPQQRIPFHLRQNLTLNLTNCRNKE